MREIAGELSDIKEQQTYVLQEGSRDVKVTWRIDFSATVNKTGKTLYIEAKGFPTDVYKLKLKMFKYQAKHDLEIWGGNYRSPFLLEKIEI